MCVGGGGGCHNSSANLAKHVKDDKKKMKHICYNAVRQKQSSK